MYNKTMTETTELRVTQKPSFVSFLEEAPGVYSYDPVGFNPKTKEITVVRQLEEPQAGGKQLNATEKGRITISLEDINRSLDWLGKQVVQPDQAISLARTAVNLAKAASFVQQRQTTS